jgi:hypothetical protein
MEVSSTATDDGGLSQLNNDSITSSGYQFGRYNFPLAFLYVAVFLLAGFQVSRILYYRHNILGFQFWFLLILLTWSVLRALFFFFVYQWDEVAFLILIWLPYWLQFATFSFLALFYFVITHTNSVSSPAAVASSSSSPTASGAGDARALRLGLSVWVSVNVLLLLTFAAMVAVVERVSSHLSESFVQGAQVCIAMMWVVLATLLAVFGWRVSGLLQRRVIRIPFHPKRAPPALLNACTLLLFLIFCSRAVYDFFAAVAFRLVSVQDTIAWRQAVVFLVYLVWEILPALVVLFVSWEIPRTRVGGFRRFAAAGTAGAAGSTASAGVGGSGAGRAELRTAGAHEAAPLLDPTTGPAVAARPGVWESEARYDSDEEDGAGDSSVPGSLQRSLLTRHSGGPYPPHLTLYGTAGGAGAGGSSSSSAPAPFNYTGPHSPYPYPPLSLSTNALPADLQPAPPSDRTT